MDILPLSTSKKYTKFEIIPETWFQRLSRVTGQWGIQGGIGGTFRLQVFRIHLIIISLFHTIFSILVLNLDFDFHMYVCFILNEKFIMYSIYVRY